MVVSSTRRITADTAITSNIQRQATSGARSAMTALEPVGEQDAEHDLELD